MQIHLLNLLEVSYVQSQSCLRYFENTQKQMEKCDKEKKYCLKYYLGHEIHTPSLCGDFHGLWQVVPEAMCQFC